MNAQMGKRSMGGCHNTCPCVLVGVQLDAANRDSPQLHMMAGTWGKTFHPFPDAARQAQIMPGYGAGQIKNVDEIQATA